MTAERHPLTDGLNWSGLLVPGTGSMAPGENATMLLWRENTPLAWLEEGALFLNWSWEDSNADRLPATVLMVRRFMEAVQARVPGVTTATFPEERASVSPEAPGSSTRRRTGSGKKRPSPGACRKNPASSTLPGRLQKRLPSSTEPSGSPTPAWATSPTAPLLTADYRT